MIFGCAITIIYVVKLWFIGSVSFSPLMARIDTPLSSVFSNDFWGLSLSDPESHKSYRPLTILSFRLNRILHGMWAPGFHVLNIAAHGLVSVLFLQFCLKLGVTMWTGVAASLLFAAHPIHTETVCLWLHIQCFLFYPQRETKSHYKMPAWVWSVVASFPVQFVQGKRLYL